MTMRVQTTITCNINSTIGDNTDRYRKSCTWCRKMQFKSCRLVAYKVNFCYEGLPMQPAVKVSMAKAPKW